MEPLDKEFVDNLEAKKFKANKSDRAENTDKIVKKLDELKPTDTQRNVKDAMEAFFQSMQGEKGEQGEQGEQGVQGEKGETGEQGRDGLDGVDGRDGLDGKDGVDGKDGKDGEKGLDGKDGKDGSPDTPEEIVEKLKTIKEAWVALSQIKGLEELLNETGQNFLQQAKGFVPRSLDSLFDVNVRGVIQDGQSLIWNAAKQKWIPGSTSSTGGGSLAVETPVGTQNDSSLTFTVSNTPVFLTINGQVLTGSGVDFTYSAGTITMITAPSSTDVFRSYHN